MAAPSRRLVSGAIAARLSGVTHATGYYAQIGRSLVAGATVPADPPAKDDDDPRVQPYFVFFPGTGGDGPDAPLGGVDEAVEIDFRVTAAGGDVDDVLALVDRLEGQLLGWAPDVAGVACSWVKRQPGYRAGVLTDRTVSPDRLFVPLQFNFTAHT